MTTSSGVRYPFASSLPSPGGMLEVAPGVHWVRMPLPFALDHINLWVLEDDEGWTIVDTGYGVEATQELWTRLLDGPLGDRPVKRIVVTHYHPDHVGCAAWLAARTGATVWMTTAEFLSAHAARDDTAGFDRATGIDFFGRNGLDTSKIPEKTRLGNAYRRGVPDLPRTYRRMMHGDELVIGGHAWEVITVFGHAPEHAALHCESRGLLISGDQVLPRITPNVSVFPTEPHGDPLNEWLRSSARLREILPDDLLVLPAHEAPFYGLHVRLNQVIEGHKADLGSLFDYLREPRRVVDCFPALFNRELEGDSLGLATGETLAHLNCLLGRRGITRRADTEGVNWYEQNPESSV